MLKHGCILRIFPVLLYTVIRHCRDEAPRLHFELPHQHADIALVRPVGVPSIQDAPFTFAVPRIQVNHNRPHYFLHVLLAVGIPLHGAVPFKYVHGVERFEARVERAERRLDANFLLIINRPLDSLLLPLLHCSYNAAHCSRGVRLHIRLCIFQHFPVFFAHTFRLFRLQIACSPTCHAERYQLGALRSRQLRLPPRPRPPLSEDVGGGYASRHLLSLGHTLAGKYGLAVADRREPPGVFVLRCAARVVTGVEGREDVYHLDGVG
mmetsp:Transcript_11683/g.31436  ORF Transcript_11683/g.31436 Transcript_11683/m.31436 type:complete len:265 (+) Transcript_11683:1068-1862(+)